VRVARSSWSRFPRPADATKNPRRAVRAGAPRPMASAGPASKRKLRRIGPETLPSHTQPIEYGQGGFFRASRQVPGGADARRAPLLATARGDELARLVHQ